MKNWPRFPLLLLISSVILAGFFLSCKNSQPADKSSSEPQVQDSLQIREIKHNAPNQAEIDSIKQQKTKAKQKALDD